jgi:hypothetical protein
MHSSAARAARCPRQSWPDVPTVRVPLPQFDALVRLADALPGASPLERAEQLCALAAAYLESVRAGAEYRPAADKIERNSN